MEIEEEDKSEDTSYKNFNSQLEAFWNSHVPSQNKNACPVPFRILFSESKALDIDLEVITRHMSMNWEELEDLFFNFAKIDEKLYSEFQLSKNIERLIKSFQH